MNTRSGKKSQAAVPEEKVEKVNKSATKTKSAKSKNTDALVANIIDSIKEENSKETEVNSTSNETNQVKKPAPKKIGQKKPVRGLPKSGRPWKEVKEKFSKIKKTIKRRPFEKKEKLRQDLTHIKELSRSIKEEKKQENVDKKQRRHENAQRRLENERKSEIVQVIKNPAKLKRMKKKALRKIEKRDLDAGKGPKVV